MFFTVSVGAALTFRLLPFGWIKYILVLVGATFAARYLLEAMLPGDRPAAKAVYDNRSLCFIALIALVSILDSFYILGMQGFAQDGVPYFRPPFHSDNERSLILVNSLLREDSSPFLPGAGHGYQMLWLHFSALFVSLLDKADNYQAVMGTIDFTAYTFFFLLFWTLYTLRPVLFRRSFILFLLVILFVTHADIVNLYMSAAVNGVFAFEADGSLPNRLIRFFSAKAVTQTAPQHTFFLIPLISFLVSRRWWREEGLRTDMHRLFHIAAMMLASPVLAVLVLPFYFLHEGITLLLKRRHEPSFWKTAAGYVGKTTVFILVSVLLYYLVLQIDPFDILSRNGDQASPRLSFRNSVEFWVLLRKMPLIMLAALGALGLLLFVFMVRALLFRCLRVFASPFFFLSAALFAVFILILYTEGGEVRRHATIAFSVLAIPFAILLLPPSWRLIKPSFHRYFLLVLTLVATLSHSYYLYAYTVKPSVVSADFDWDDYRCMNTVLRNKYPGIPVFAAAEEGLRFPLVMEVTSSFSVVDDAYVHSRVTSDKAGVLARIAAGANPVYHLDELGLKYVLWGELEEMKWGREVYERVIRPGEVIEECGTVKLVRPADHKN